MKYFEEIEDDDVNKYTNGQIFSASEKPIDFNSPEIKKQMEAVMKEIKMVMDGQKIDTSKLHKKFDI